MSATPSTVIAQLVDTMRAPAGPRPACRDRWWLDRRSVRGLGIGPQRGRRRNLRAASRPIEARVVLAS
jgi:hypothetical protein